MKKGKFGIVLCFYPIAAFAAVILNSPLICAILAAAAIFLEQDEWTGRQSLQAWMAGALVYFFDSVVKWGLSLFRIPFLSTVLSVVSTILCVVVYLAAIIFSILGIVRVSKGEEANIPLLSSLAYRAYGKVRPKPVAPAAPYTQPYAAPQPGAYPYPDPNGMNPPAQPQQPYPPQYPPQNAVPQYAPPMSAANQPPQQNGQNGQDGPTAP